MHYMHTTQVTWSTNDLYKVEPVAYLPLSCSTTYGKVKGRLNIPTNYALITQVIADQLIATLNKFKNKQTN